MLRINKRYIECPPSESPSHAPQEGELGFCDLISLGDFLEKLREAPQNQPSYHARKITVKETLVASGHQFAFLASV
jgi:hypothetical protein